MGRRPCCDKSKVKRGSWSPQEDATLKNYIHTHGIGGNWITLPQKAGLERCGKSCRLRWLNYLRPNIKHGDFTHHEDFIISNLFNTIGSRWSIISSHLPGRTDNDVKNYWNTKLKKKHMMATAHTSTHPNKSELISTDQRNAATVDSATATGAATASQIVPTNEQALQDFPTPYDVPSVLNEPIILSYPGYSFNHGGSSGNYMNFPFCPSHQDFSPIFHESNGVKMDGYSFEFVNDIWSHEEVAINGGNSDADLFSIFPCSF